MTSKVGFRTAGFRDWDLRQALECLGAIGYDGVELCLEHPQTRPETIRQEGCFGWARAAAEAGLEIASVSYHGDGEEYASRAENQVRAVEIAAQCGATVLILNGERAIEGREAEQWDAFAAHLRTRILPRAGDLGVLVGLEPEPGHYLHSSADLLWLVAEVGHPALGANLDVGHAWLTDPDLPRTIRDLAPRLWHLHWEDFPTGEHRHLVPGTGDMPLAAVHAALREAGYAGYYTVDLFNIADDPETPARESLGAVRALLQAGG
jgi:sugar phosphate isomerase/epimerase